MKYNTYTSSEVYLLTQELLIKQVNASTVLYLSGGSTPKHLYELIAQEKIFHPGAVAMIDERFGEKWHENSNELMMKESGILHYLEKNDIPFQPMLTDKSREETAEVYDQTLRTLHAQYPRHIALLGIGADGHIAGIPAGDSAYKEDGYALVTSYDGEKMGERITQTFLALSMMDEIIVLVLGDEKKKALELMKTVGSESEVPARFLMRDTISEKVTIVTDQIL